jgi:hyaluronan synthase
MVLLTTTVFSLLVRFTTTRWKFPDTNYTPSFSILMSAFNESENVYTCIKSFLSCDYPPDKLNVVVVNDCSKDDTWQWIQKAEADFPGRVIAINNEKNLGKPKSCVKAFHMSNGEIVVNADSDGEVHPRTIRALANSFSNPKIGAVGGNVIVRNHNASWVTRIQAFQYNVVFQIAKIGETVTRTVRIISGCLIALRREIYTKALPEVEKRNWFGLPVQDGEDSFLTLQAMLQGYQTVINLEAITYTDAPTTLGIFFTQMLRWMRGSHRLFFWSLRRFWKFTSVIDGFSLLRSHVYGFAVILWPLLFGLSIATGSLTSTILIKLSMLCLWVVTGTFAWVAYEGKGKQSLAETAIAFFLSSLWIMIHLTFVNVLALFTLHSVKWEKSK